jgi:RNA polymerase sigma-70 factor (ECF subfamily)
MRTDTTDVVSSKLPLPSISTITGDKRPANLGLRSESSLETFDEIMLPHLDAAYNLARWLTLNEQDAQDVLQEACLRAFRYFDNFRGGNPKAWLLEVVRNTSRTWTRRRRQELAAMPFDETEHGIGADEPNQEEATAGVEKAAVLRGCIEGLPVEFREILIMRELEEMSYREIADSTGLAPGTIMSRLSRARKRLTDCAGRSKGAHR